jgi:hypothetical protein
LHPVLSRRITRLKALGLVSREAGAWDAPEPARCAPWVRSTADPCWPLSVAAIKAIPATLWLLWPVCRWPTKWAVRHRPPIRLAREVERLSHEVLKLVRKVSVLYKEREAKTKRQG